MITPHKKWVLCLGLIIFYVVWARDGLPQSLTYQPLEGDVAFQSLPHCPLVDAIEGCTHSPWSHCGIVRKTAKGWMVIEAIGPVKQTPLELWKLQGRRGTFVAKRLKKQDATIISHFVAAALKFEGRPYDIHYRLDDDAIYCSELIYKAYLEATGKRLGKLVKLEDLDWKPQATIIKSIEGTVPLDRVMITPLALFESEELEDAPVSPALVSTKK